MRKVEGVTQVQVSLKQGLTTLELQPGNTVTVEQLRTIIKNNGFVSKEADIIARGRIVGSRFEVQGTREMLTPAGPPKPLADGRSQFVVKPEK
ncbi:MAG TPA: heavy metal-associated domain-containing protein [Vicinamibacterales bacterium]|nr:heavy metal-associated domain-containing protein [Vicinamibacterales bacterium]